MIRLKTLPLAVTVISTIFIGIFLAKAVGYYETTSSKTPVTFKTGELAGRPNPADIRGSYTWQDVEKAFGVPAKEAAEAFSPPGQALDPAKRVSALEEIYATILPIGLEIGTGAVRLFVSLYTGLPFTAEEGAVLPNGALAMLAALPGADQERLAKFKIPISQRPVDAAPTTNVAVAPVAGTPVIATPAATPAPAVPSAPSVSSTPAVPPASPSSAPAAAQAPPAQSETVHSTGTGSGSGTGAGTSSTGRAVVGKTTFGDLYDWGLTPSQVEAILGYKPGPRTQGVRDNAIANGREFSEFKMPLQALLDKMGQ